MSPGPSVPPGELGERVSRALTPRTPRGSICVLWLRVGVQGRDKGMAPELRAEIGQVILTLSLT